MTNEQFEAEVFRRAKQYQAEKQVRRRRIFTGALAFAGCFVLVFAAAKLLPLRKMNNTAQMNTDKADTAQNEMYDAEKAEAEYSEDACAEQADEAGYTQQAGAESGEVRRKNAEDAFYEGSISEAQLDTKTEGWSMGAAEREEASSEDEAAKESVEESAAESVMECFQAAYGLRAMPEQVGSFVLTSKDLMQDDAGFLFVYTDEQTGTVIYVQALDEDGTPQDLLAGKPKNSQFSAGSAKFCMLCETDDWKTLTDFTDTLYSCLSE